MAQIPSLYVRAMQEFRAFHDLLYICLRDSLPEATLSTSGAYGWRGYRIDAYKTLAKGQYYLLTYPEDPKHLILEETYWDSQKKLCRPFMLRLNLQESRFFSLNAVEQRAFLSEFVKQTSRQALIWQVSHGRTTHIPLDMLEGREVHRHARNKPAEPRQIADDYLISTLLQNQLLGMLADAIRSAAESLPLLYANGVKLRINDQWRNWDHRGYRMKPLARDSSEPQGRYPYRWNIYYDDPARVCLEAYDGERAKRVNSIDLQRAGFFDLEEIEQQKRLESFVLQALG